MNRDEREGKVQNVKGRVKEAGGIISGNPDLEREGAEERSEGAVREGLGRARRKVGEALEDLGEDVKKD